MDTDMDIDMDIDLGPIGQDEDFQLEVNDPSPPPYHNLNESNGALSAQMPRAEPDAITSDAIASDKVHLRGLDSMTTHDIKGFSAEHFPSHPPVRVEWIDDTSANIVFDSPDICAQALERFVSSPQSMDYSDTPPELQLRAAKIPSTHPGSTLSVRMASVTDQKRPRAYEASRFYMMHPEHDPREQRRRNGSRRASGDYQKRRYGDEEHRRRKNRDQDDGFDASMYDDNHSSSRRNSTSSSQGGRPRRLLDSYRPDRDTATGRSRDRSASPNRQNGPRATHRARTPPPSYRLREPNPFPTENKGKELFPAKNAKAEGKDLFSNKLLASQKKAELFPHKVNSANHRRSDVFDAADETAELFVPRLNGSRSRSKGLAARISQASESYGRLNLDDPMPTMEPANKADDNSLNIRGAAQGISIRGTASHVGTIKELFPEKANAGKELFAEKLEGRGGRRQKAEDMFS